MNYSNDSLIINYKEENLTGEYIVDPETLNAFELLRNMPDVLHSNWHDIVPCVRGGKLFFMMLYLETEVFNSWFYFKRATKKLIRELNEQGDGIRINGTRSKFEQVKIQKDINKAFEMMEYERYRIEREKDETY
jgi:hypothetical protein